MEDELLCGVCHDMYAAGHREPVVLPSCGHAFCRGCLAKLEADGEELGAGFSCPTCRTPHDSMPVHTLPPVFALLHLSENYRKSQRGGEGRCVSHGSTVEFWCCECQKELCGHCLLEGHVKEGHSVQTTQSFLNTQQRDVQTMGSWLRWELNQRQKTLLKEMAGLVTRLVRLANHSRVLHDLGGRVTKVLEEAGRVTIIEEMVLASTLMGSLESEIKNTLSRNVAPANRTLLRCMSCIEAPKSTPVAKPRPESISEVNWMHKLTESATGPEESAVTSDPASVGGEEIGAAEANTSLRQEEVEAETVHGDDGFQSLAGEDSEERVPEELASAGNECTWPVQCRVTMGGERQGRLCWEDGRVHAYALTTNDTAGDLLLQLPFLRSLRHDAQPEVFLDVATEERLVGRVYIKLWGHLRRALHFLNLCMGTHGPSYRGSKFHGVAKRGSMGETLAGGRYLTDDGGNSVQALMEGLEWGGQHIREKVAGLVVAASAGSPEQDAFFHICTRDHPGRKFACAFGEVYLGMEVVRTAVSLHPSHTVKIIDCGLVLPLSPGVRGDADSKL